MKRGTIRHPKTLDLAAYLFLPPWGALGLLESLLDWTFEYARTGAIGKFSDHAIARGVGWDGEPSTLVQGLVDATWVDRCGYHRLVIHGLAEHASDTWKTLMKRQGLEFAQVVEPVSRVGPVQVQDEYGTSTGQVPYSSGTSPDKSVPPAPAPAPAPSGSASDEIEDNLSGNPRESPSALLAAWNLHRHTLPEAKGLTPARRRHATARLQERPLAEWVDLIERLARSPFCQGLNDRGWKADFGWLIGSPDVALKIAEGKYDHAVRLETPKTAGNLAAAHAWLTSKEA